MRIFSRLRAVSAVLCICLFCCACSGSVDSSAPVVTTTSATSTAAPVDDSSVPIDSGAAAVPSGFSSSSVSATQSQPIESVDSYDSETTETPSDVDDPSVETTEPPEQTSTVETTETTTTPVPETTTTPVPDEPPEPVEVVIPEIMAVSTPMENAEVCDDAFIDYSNASNGYIAAAYSGDSDRAKIRIVCGGVVNDHDLVAGGVTEYFPLTQGSGEYTIQIYEHVEGKNYSFVTEITENISIPDTVSMYLYPNKYSMFERSSDCVYKAAELCTGADGTIEKLAAIFGYITDNVTYDYDLAAAVTSGYYPDPDAVLAAKKGICFDYSSLFAAMARSQGIPTRLVIGYAADNIYHAWNEVYTEQTGWITPQLLLADSGYNIVDSTFYAGAADKEQISRYISDESNYSAIYRY